MLDMIVVTLLVAAPLIVILVAVWWGTLRLLDIAGGQSFRKDLWVRLHENPVALAGYLGDRAKSVALIVLGVAILLAAFLRL